MRGVQNLAKYGEESSILSKVPKFSTGVGRAAYYGDWHGFLGRLMHDSKLDGVVLCAVAGGQLEFLDKFLDMFRQEVLAFDFDFIAQFIHGTQNDGSLLNAEMCDACTPGLESALFHNQHWRHFAPAGCRCCETTTRRILSAREERGGRRRRAKTKMYSFELGHSGRACRHCNHAHASRGIVGALQGNAGKSPAAHVQHQEL